MQQPFNGTQPRRPFFLGEPPEGEGELSSGSGGRRLSGSEEQLSPLNYEEFAYQQQLIEELIQENKDLKGKLEDSEAHLATTEAKLQRSN